MNEIHFLNENNNIDEKEYIKIIKKSIIKIDFYKKLVEKYNSYISILSSRSCITQLKNIINKINKDMKNSEKIYNDLKYIKLNDISSIDLNNIEDLKKEQNKSFDKLKEIFAKKFLNMYDYLNDGLEVVYNDDEYYTIKKNECKKVFGLNEDECKILNRFLFDENYPISLISINNYISNDYIDY